MHPDAYRYVEEALSAIPAPTSVLEFGSRDINGTVRRLLPGTDYTGVDLSAGDGVDVVADARDYTHPHLVDLIVSTELLEHTDRPDQVIACAYRNLRRPGTLILTAAGEGRPPHGADGSPKPSEGEHYANVTFPDLDEWIRDAGFDYHTITINGRDIYATAHTA